MTNNESSKHSLETGDHHKHCRGKLRSYVGRVGNVPRYRVLFTESESLTGMDEAGFIAQEMR